ncbi:ribonucleoside triphosphate reductase [Candidatus Dojkabacteria bacterium]|nr:ribonucleoside triphosphate reductase [Candidatus Dojkabacteria bacterium]
MKKKTARVSKKRDELTEIKKRDGSVVPFQQDKITQAIWKAMDSVGQADLKAAQKVSDKVVKELKKRTSDSEIPTVEEIQDLVERQLVLERLPETAKAYILYRDLHSRIRNIQNLFDVGGWISDYLKRDNWKVNGNSSYDYHLQGMYKNMVEDLCEMYWMNEVYSDEMRDLHNNKDFHIHKSSTISAYCVGWDLQDILLEGFTGVQGNVTSAPAKHFRSALGQLVNFMYTLTNESPDGAVAVSSLDTYLAPFIRHDNLSYKQVKQGLQEFIYNMNVPTKSGGQVVFSNVTLDLECPSHMKDQAVIIGGKPQDEKYGDFQKEMDMFNRALIEVYVEGDAKGRAFTFPIPTYNIGKDFDWENSNLDGLWEMTAKYGIPYFANFVNSDMDPEDARSMCCRLRIDNRELQKRGGGYFGANPLTGSIGYVTINLPRLAYLNKGDKEGFFEKLGRLMDVADESLSSRRRLIEELTEKGLYPYSKFYLRSIKERTGKYWTNHFNTIGLIGMNEACLNFFEPDKEEDLHDITSDLGQEFANEVLDFMNRKLLEYQEKRGEMYNLEASPAEGASYAIARMDKDLYPDIIVANEEAYREGAAPYYTNSTQLPVGYTDDIFEALDLQDDLQAKYTGGTVFHGFIGERLNGGAEAKELVKKIAQGYKLPYFTLSPTFSICEEHGYVNGEHFECPDCGRECMVYSRVVGKIAPVQRWNKGKKSEFKERKCFNNF